MVIYTDGSCRGNGKANSEGGFGVCVVEDGQLVDIYQQFQSPTTNNEMELKAILYAFLKYGTKDNFFVPTVYSDSAYAVNTLTNWMYNWAAKDWKKADKKTPENLELIKAYYDWEQLGYKINLQKIAGHANHKYNELADALATGRIHTLEEALEFDRNFDS